MSEPAATSKYSSRSAKGKGSTSAAAPEPKCKKTDTALKSTPVRPASFSKQNRSKKGKKRGNSRKGSADNDDDDRYSDSSAEDDESSRRPPQNDHHNRQLHTTSGYPIKRIIEEHVVSGKTGYLVEWLPTLANKATARGDENEIVDE
jgi:hypothetical protein